MIRNLLLALLIPIALYAEDAASVLARTDQSRNQMSSFAVDVELTSSTPDGRHETSKFRVYGKGSDRSVVEFIAPQTEKGKILLMLRDAMWIYMPSASRPIRISPLQRLMGQASNGDVARMNFGVDYQPAAIADDGDTWVLDLAAKDPSVAFNRVRLWVDKQSFAPRRADFYVVSGKLIKHATYAEDRVEIDDALRPGHRTVMRYTNRVARENPERMFTKDALGKW
jgi:outer membrane lipoprotein-sorting protein